MDLANLPWALESEPETVGKKLDDCLYFDVTTKSLRSTDCFDGVLSCTLCQFPENRQIFRLKYECESVLDFESHFFFDFDSSTQKRVLYGILGRENLF